MTGKFFGAALMFIMFALGVNPAFAVTSDWTESERLKFRIVASAADEAGAVRGAFEINLAGGWHTYWRTPGDSGLAPELDFEDSENVETIGIEWPLPQRFEHYGLYTFGYEGRFFLPFSVRKANPAKDLTLNVDAKIMVCKVICVPESVQAELEIPARFRQDPELESRLRDVREKIPVQDDTPGLRIENAVVSKDMLVVTVFAQHGMDDTDLFVEAEGLTISAPPEIALFSGDVRRAHLKIPAPPDVENFADALTGKKTVLTLSNRGRAVEKEIVF